MLALVLSYITKSDDKEMLDRFFVKMKTQVLPDRQQDDEQIKLSYMDPSRFDHLKMFAKTQLEITKWSKVDIIGFAVSCMIAAVIFLLLYLMISVGK